MSPDEKAARLIDAASALLAAAPKQQLNTLSLNKGLFYLDLVSLRDAGEVFTCNAYIALENGPVVAKYKDRLLKRLESLGVATLTQIGSAKRIQLVKPPEFSGSVSTISDIATRIARWCSNKTADELSVYSHDNPGWIIARQDESLGRGAKCSIDMNIAMQQIADEDPWMDLPLADPERASCNAVDVEKGQPW